jgi:alcohol dehydrogenase class IV
LQPEQAAALRKFLAPEFVFGTGALALTGRFAGNLGVTRALLVSDPGVRRAGWLDAVAETLRDQGIGFEVFEGVSPNPRAAQVMAGARAFRLGGCDALVAVGGGSVLDCAKGIGIVVANGGHILDFEGVDQVAEPMPPTICVPTTGGSSADVSQFAIITDEDRRVKIAVISKAVVPDISLIDPRTLTTMDPHLAACTGLDALSHAFEAYVSIGASPITDVHALESIRLIHRHLQESIGHPDQIEPRSQVMLASLQAGLAFSNASLGGVHAMSHSLGGLLDLPHGECNALLLEHVVAFNFAEAEVRYRRIAEAMGIPCDGVSAKVVRDRLLEEVHRVREAVGVSGGLSNRGVERSAVAGLTRNALNDPCVLTNPRRPFERDIEALYVEAL